MLPGFAAALSAAVVVAAPVAARELPRIAFLSMGFHEMAAGEVVDGVAQGSISLTTDLTGDGREDEARVLLNPAQDRALLVVVASSSATVDTYILRDVTLAEGRRLRISLSSSHGRPALMVDDGAGRNLEQFDGEDFRPVTG